MNEFFTKKMLYDKILYDKKEGEFTLEEESNFKIYVSEDRLESQNEDNTNQADNTVKKFVTMENATSNALSNLDNGLVPIEDYVREVDRTKRKTREEKAFHAQSIDEHYDDIIL